MKKWILIAAFAITAMAVQLRSASAADPYAVTHVWSQSFANAQPWHGNYYYMQWGQPVALIVPPQVHSQQTYSWGVSQNLTYPIHHQFGRS
ncbi:MAG: hypothetical protein AAFN70_02775, partial [Planctomycetota bacterium]